MKQNRFKSWALWTAVVSQVLAILLLTNVIGVQDSQLFNQIATAVLQLLVLFGVINNPTVSKEI